MNVAAPGYGQPEQHADAACFGCVSGREDEPAVEPVCSLACGEHEQNEWKKLGEPDESQIERIVRQLIHMPADTDLHHLPAERRAESRGDVDTEIAVVERSERRQPRHRLVRHEPLPRCLTVSSNDWL